MLAKNLDFHDQLVASWNAMGEGAPMLAALAGICAKALYAGPESLGDLSEEEQAILFAAKDRGVIEVRGVNTGYEAPLRFLAVYVELSEHDRLELRRRDHPEMTIRFFDAFYRLCRRGYVLHHLYHDFSLSMPGFEASRQVDTARSIELLRAFGYERDA